MGFLNLLMENQKKKWNENNCFHVGKELARFHLVNKNLNPINKNHFSLDFWNTSLKKYENFIIELIPNSLNIIKEEIKFLNQNWPIGLPEGIIHADLFPDNVLFNTSEKISGMIDFYFACHDFFSYDIAILINAWCFPNNNFNNIFMKNLLKGYESIRKLENNERKNLNIFLRGASLRFLLTRIIDIKKREPKF